MGLLDETWNARVRTLPPGARIAPTTRSPILNLRTRPVYVPGPSFPALGQGEDVAFLFLEEAAGEPILEVPPSLRYPLVQSADSGTFILLRKGDQGEPVRQMQLQLRRLGFPVGTIDGIFGAVTEAALRLFQQRSGLPATGTLDELSWGVMQSAVPGLPSNGRADGGAVRSQTTTPSTLPTPTSTPGTAGPPGQQFLGVPTGIWLALGVVVVVLLATSVGGRAVQRAGPAPARA
ncbi:MAG: peptidoglycan-binding protein [candidate division NC10 bacterium]|nr:peptidoglycan-binding protein [candidate division NC10 bacterium]